MNTHKYYFLILLPLLLFYGCGQAASAAAPEQVEILGAETVYGKIKEINGNEILLALGDYSTQSSGSFGEGAPAESSESVGEDRQLPEGMPNTAEGRGAGSTETTDSGNQTPDMAGGRGSGGSPTGEGGFGGGQRQGGASGNMPGSGGSNRTTVTLTGEEKTWVIPVTAKVTSGEGENARDIRFTQLAVKNVVRLSLNAEGEILKVEVLQ